MAKRAKSAGKKKMPAKSPNLNHPLWHHAQVGLNRLAELVTRRNYRRTLHYSNES